MNAHASSPPETDTLTRRCMGCTLHVQARRSSVIDHRDPTPHPSTHEHFMKRRQVLSLIALSAAGLMAGCANLAKAAAAADQGLLFRTISDASAVKRMLMGHLPARTHQIHAAVCR